MNNAETKIVRRRSPEVVVYVDPRKKKKYVQPVLTSDENNKTSDAVITMKRVRFEVHKFGIQGFQRKQKEEAEVQRAISLGAKPPKNKFYNYKEYIAMRKEEKRIALELRQNRPQKTNTTTGNNKSTRTINKSKKQKRKK